MKEREHPRSHASLELWSDHETKPERGEPKTKDEPDCEAEPLAHLRI